MKILAIRGKNLASLARQFEVDFTQEPLLSTGIFAITGPTGAGKSTLLDALCLALYDDMPRLPREGYRGYNLPDVSGETIAPRDPRSILRRGAAEGFAEVDFVGSDGIAYRAHWSVRRARVKAEGKLQNTEMSLLRISDEQPIGSGRKTEVLPAIAERIGLSFEQFTRAVLLAQNEFSAFLKASDDKRAELLQTLTGTDLFADLSRRAYQRAKVAEQNLQQLRERLAALQVFSHEERQQKELEASRAQLSVQSLEAERSQLEQQLQWYQQEQQLQSAYQRAEQALSTALAEEQAASQRREFLQHLESVQVARGTLENWRQSTSAVNRTQQSLTQAEQHQLAVEQTKREAQQALELAQETLAAKQGAYQQLQPDLIQARELDTIIQTLLPRHAKALTEQQAAQQLIQQLEQATEQQSTELTRLAKQEQQLKEWLATQNESQRLAEQWPHWQNLFQQAQAQLQRQQSLDAELTELKHTQTQQEQHLKQLQIAAQKAQQVLVAAEQAYQAAQQQTLSFDLESLAQQREVLNKQRTQLQAAQQAWETLTTAESSTSKLEQDLAALQQDQAKTQLALEQYQQQIPQCERDSERAEHAWRMAEAACADQAEHWRSSLKAGDACPVCGALEHPYTQQLPALNVVLARLKEDYKQQRQNLKTLEAEQASQQAYVEQYQTQELKLKQQLVQAKATSLQAQQAWAVYADLVSGKDISASLQQQLAQQQQLLAQQSLAEQAARQAQQAADATQQTYLQAQQAALSQHETVTKASNTLQLIAAEHQYLQQSLNESAEQLESLLLSLGSAFSDEDWRASYLSAPLAFAKQCEQAVHVWQRRQQALQQILEQAAELAQQQTQQAFALSQAQQEAARLSQQRERLQHELVQQQQVRQSLFAGQAVSELEQIWQSELAALNKQLLAQQSAYEQAQLAAARALEVQAQTQHLFNEQQAQAAQLQLDLDQHLSSFAQAALILTVDELTALLAYQPAWLQTERAALQALQLASSQAQAVLNERQQQLTQHQLAQEQIAGQAEIQASYANTQEQLSLAQQAWQELRLVLRNDEQRREQASGLQEALAQLTSQARIWGQLNDLIGSADGKKFRNFAQQYSLDVLLGYANRHLADLSRRYTLRRVRESLALLVLDQDMGGEIRSVHSLSGGESFLVSLALALGLASLSSQRVKVESLFIDEGFGSLDADSLRIAMDALDQLQAQGRKVGVISHVQEMTERIAVQIQVRRLSGGQSALTVKA
jgi:exonuclease SbcC